MIDLNPYSLKSGAKLGLAVTLIVALSACAHDVPKVEPITPVTDTEAFSQPEPAAAATEAAPARPARRHKHGVAKHQHRRKSHLTAAQKAKPAEVKAVTGASVQQEDLSPPPAPPQLPTPPPALLSIPQPATVPQTAGFPWVFTLLGLFLACSAGVYWYTTRAAGKSRRRLVYNS